MSPTHRQTILRTTDVAIGRIYAMHAMGPNNTCPPYVVGVKTFVTISYQYWIRG